MTARYETHLHSRLLSGSGLDADLRAQVKREEDSALAGAANYKRLALQAIKRGDGASLKPAERLILHWFQVVAPVLEDEQKRVRAGEYGVNRALYGAILLQLSPEVLAVLALRETLGACLKQPMGVKFTDLCGWVGRAVFGQINLALLRAEDVKRRGAHRNRVSRERAEGKEPSFKSLPNELELLRELDRRCRDATYGKVTWWAKKTLEEPAVERRVQVAIGAFLVEEVVRLSSCADYLTEKHDPSFTIEARQVRTDDGSMKTPNFVMLSERAKRTINEGHDIRQFLRPKFTSMRIPPMPWGRDDQGREIGGGFVRIRLPLIIKATRAQRRAVEAADMSEFYPCLNALNSTSWSIHDRVMSAQRAEFDAGGGSLLLPRRDPLPSPAPPKGHDPAAPIGKRWAKVGVREKHAYKVEARRIHEDNHLAEGARKQFFNLLDEAEQWKRTGREWITHRVDFRGRAVPDPQYLTPHKDDLARGLLRFGSPRDASGPRAQFWLRVHAANCYGVDKLPFRERVQWADDHMAQISACARDPAGTEFWRHADESRPGNMDGKPWQFLAACIALTDPKEAAYLPVQLDGTCNGLQHYAALARDPEAAAMVNLSPSDRPQDVYRGVTETARAIVNSDAIAGNPIARRLQDWVTRPIIKQNVMTTFYGVTPVGARRQVLAVLKQAGFADEAGEVSVYKASEYLSAVTLRAVARACPSATAIMEWLSSLARAVSKSNKSRKGAEVAWTAPHGFPVVQPYYNERATHVVTLRHTLKLMEPGDRVAVDGQVDGFAPNYIHSIDAAHMFRSAKAAADRNLSFGAVHDCFWMHAADADEVSQIIRDQFVLTHSGNLLVDLHDEISRHHNMLCIDTPPARGSFDIELARVAEYAFS